jgi:hypothetical protein
MDIKDTTLLKTMSFGSFFGSSCLGDECFCVSIFISVKFCAVAWVCHLGFSKLF